MTILKIEHLYKKYSNKYVLEDINLKIKKGEFFTIIGPNGAGKTTLLRLIDLLDSPTSGKIIFDGIDTTKCSETDKIHLRRRMSFVFQKPILFNTTVFENVAYGLKIRKVNKSTIKRKVMEILELVGLADLWNKQAIKLSGGEAQRVALARALIVEPEVLLLDEPTANLDPRSTAMIEKIILNVNKEKKTTIVMATHNMFQAKRIAQRIAFLFYGKIIEVGKPDEIFAKPNDPRTKAFIKGEIY